MGKEFPLYQKDRDLCFSDLEIIGDDIDQTQERGRRKIQGEIGEEMAPLGHRKARDLPHPAQGQPLQSCTVHLPQDSSTVNSRKNLAISTIQLSSSITIRPPEPIMEPSAIKLS